MESWGAHVLIFLILAISFIEKPDPFFLALLMATKVFPWVAGTGGCPGFPQWPRRPLPMVSFLLMNMLFVLF